MVRINQAQYDAFADLDVRRFSTRLEALLASEGLIGPEFASQEVEPLVRRALDWKFEDEEDFVDLGRLRARLGKVFDREDLQPIFADTAVEPWLRIAQVKWRLTGVDA